MLLFHMKDGNSIVASKSEIKTPMSYNLNGLTAPTLRHFLFNKLITSYLYSKTNGIKKPMATR